MTFFGQNTVLKFSKMKLWNVAFSTAATVFALITLLKKEREDDRGAFLLHPSSSMTPSRPSSSHTCSPHLGFHQIFLQNPLLYLSSIALFPFSPDHLFLQNDLPHHLQHFCLLSSSSLHHTLFTVHCCQCIALDKTSHNKMRHMSQRKTLQWRLVGFLSELHRLTIFF